MGVLTSPLCCAAKCCGCIILSQLIGLLVSVGLLVAFIAAFYFYILPWGERKIISELRLPSGTDIISLNASTIAANNCSGCIFGTNTDWPTKTNGTLHFLDTKAGTTISSVVATSLVATAAAGAGTMLWASIFPTMASALSFSGGFYEMTHILEQAQYIGMIGQLQLRGAPTFLNQFSKELAWTNFNIPKSISSKFVPSRRLALTDTAVAAVKPKYEGETGPARYAKSLGVKPKDLFFYTLKVFAAVVVVIHILYVIWIMIVSCISKKESFGQIAAKWYRKVVWAILLALILAQYIFAMTGSYFIYENTRTNAPKDSSFGVGCALLVAVLGFTLFFGIIIISNNTDELKDIGTIEHDERKFSAKYSAYYDEYNFDNRFFFVPRILLAVVTGVIVGVVQNPTKQLLFVLGATFVYLVLILLREPNLLRFLYYIGLISVFMKVVLVCMMLVLVQDDFFPQAVRDKVAYAIIGVNIFIFFLLFLRQAYLVVYKIVRTCKHKGKKNDDDDDDDRRRAIEELNRPYARLNSTGDTRSGANATNNGYAQNQHTMEQNYMGSQNQHAKEQNYMGSQNQPQQPYANGRDQANAGISAGVGAGAGYVAGKYGQPTSPTRSYDQQRSMQPGAGNQNNNFNQQSSHSADNARQYQTQPEAGQGGKDYNEYAAKFGGNQGRTIADRYLGIEPGAVQNAEAGAPVVPESSRTASTQQDPREHSAGSVGAAKPEPEKFTWRRNMERRAAEAAAADDSMRQRPNQQESFLRLDSDDSYGTVLSNTSHTVSSAESSREMPSDNRYEQPAYNTAPSDDWFNQRAPSDVGSDMTATVLLQSDGTNSARTFDNASSFLTADSYASRRQGTALESVASMESMSSDGERGGLHMDAQNLDSLAEAYLKQAGDGTALTENDIGDDDDDEDEDDDYQDPILAALVELAKPVEDGDDAHAIDTNAVEGDDEAKSSKDIDLDEDADRDSVDIDDESEGDEDIDIDDMNMLDSMHSGRDSSDIEIKKVDEIGLDETPHQGETSGSPPPVRQISDISLRSDDDASFYVDGHRNESPSAASGQKERTKSSDPLKL